MFILITGLPVLFACILCKHKDALHTAPVLQKFNSMYQNRRVAQKHVEGHSTWFHPVFFVYRRTTFALLSIFWLDWPDMQILSQ